MRPLALLLLLAVPSCGGRYLVTGETLDDGSFVEFQPADVHVAFVAPTVDHATVALSEALRDRDFTISEMSAGQIVATTSTRRFTLTLAIGFNEHEAIIRYVHSDGLRIEGPMHSRYYDRVMRSLSDSITEAAARPERERREHELAVARASRTTVVAPAPTVATGVYVGGGVVVGGGVAVGGVAPGYGPMRCEDSVIRYGHSSSATIHCAGADPYCADALLRMGHNPSALLFCRGVEPSCSVRLLESGANPTALGRCR